MISTDNTILSKGFNRLCRLTTRVTCTRRTKPTSLLKKVRFSASIEMEMTLSRVDYSNKEIKACWFTDKEKSKMHAKHLKTVARLESGKEPKRGQTYRGLESYLSDKGDVAIKRCIDAVMDEQDEQWRVGHDDYAMLALVSMRKTGPSKSLALQIALRDAEHAMAGYEEDDATYASSDGETVNNAEIDFSNETKDRGSRKTCRRKKVSSVRQSRHRQVATRAA